MLSNFSQSYNNTTFTLVLYDCCEKVESFLATIGYYDNYWSQVADLYFF